MINRWWDGNPAEKYWMEITDRSDLGANLIAPTTAKGEVKHWGPGYERSLYVVDEISWSLVEGQYVLEGGRDRVWRNWEIRGDEGRLEPTRYRYTLLDN